MDKYHRKIDVDEAIELYKSGTSVQDLAKKYNVSREAIYRHIRRLDDKAEIEKRLQQERSQGAKEKYLKYKQQIFNLAKLGNSTTRIARKLNIPFVHVRWMLKDSKYDNSQETKHKIYDRIFKDYKKGMTQVALAKKYHTVQTNISRILHTHYESEL